MAHLTLRPYNLDGNKYGWRLTELIADPMNNVAWHCGNWEHNQRSLAVEVAGNWLDRTLPDQALMLLADYIRPQDQTLNGGLTLWAHKWVYATACPGALEGQIDKIVDMLNNPDKWNAQLWPAPAPTPVPAPEPGITYVKFPEAQRFTVNKQPTNLWDFSSAKWPNFDSVKTFALGEPFIAVGYAKHPKGSEYYMTSYSFGAADQTGSPAHPYGVNKVDLTPYVAPVDPTPTPTPEPTPEPPVITPPTEEPVKDPNTKPALETAKELLRLFLFAIPGYLIAYFTSLPTTETTLSVLVLLRAIDKYVHVSPKTTLKGISPV